MSSRSLTLAVAAREYIWLWDNRHGDSPEKIAAREHINAGRVRLGIARAGAREKGISQTTPAVKDQAGSLRSPRLIPMFPLTSYVPTSPCGHRRMLRVGSLFCCMVCHRSGIDGHPALQRDPRTDPSPEPKPVPLVAKKAAKETRKQKRARLYGASSPGTAGAAAGPPPGSADLPTATAAATELPPSATASGSP
jgi:hypothetical protein